MTAAVIPWASAPQKHRSQMTITAAGSGWWWLQLSISEGLQYGPELDYNQIGIFQNL